MGCRQSTVEEQVQVPAADAPVEAVAVTETAAPVAAATESETAVVAAPASTTPAVEEPKAEEAAVPAVPAAVETPAEAPAEAPAPAPASTKESVSEVSETNATTGSDAKEEVAAEVKEEAVAAPEVETVAEEPAAAVEPEVETAPVEEAVAEEEPTVSFISAGTAIDSNVVFYQFTLEDKADPAKEVIIRKRFNDFKTIHAEISKLMANESNVPSSQAGKFATYPALPPLPKSGMSSVLFGRKNKNLTADREAQFGKILNAIARHPIAYSSPAFQAFLA